MINNDDHHCLSSTERPKIENEKERERYRKKLLIKLKFILVDLIRIKSSNIKTMIISEYMSDTKKKMNEMRKTKKKVNENSEMKMEFIGNKFNESRSFVDSKRM